VPTPSRLRLLTALALATLACVAAAAQAAPGNKRQDNSPANSQAVTCATCHTEQAAEQADTQMGRAAELPGNNPTLQTHPKLAFQSKGFSYTVETRDGQSRYTVSDGAGSITVPILWSLGSQAQTWVLERDGKLYESQVSYYPSIDGLDITTGDDHRQPKTLEEALGRPIGDDETRVCFGCHTSSAVADRKLNLAAAKPGVTCEHCHVGASAHFAGVMKGDLSSVPRKLGSLSTEDLSNFCGQCHRTWETVVLGHWRGQADVRFQPYRLANSKCFDGTDPRISCVACHDPHKKLVRDSPAYYDPKCLACHAPQPPAADLKPAADSAAASEATPSNHSTHGKVCPVAKSNCVSCHMPKVSLPNGLILFSDHQIRIAKTGDPFPN
jgi:hypothetical protein